MISLLELEKIRQHARQKGYSKIATYLRDLALNHNELIEEKVIEISRNVNKILDSLENGKRKR